MDNKNITLFINNIKISICQIDSNEPITKNNEQEIIKRANDEPNEQIKPPRVELRGCRIKELHAKVKEYMEANKDVKYRAAMKIVGEQMKQK